MIDLRILFESRTILQTFSAENVYGIVFTDFTGTIARVSGNNNLEIEDFDLNELSVTELLRKGVLDTQDLIKSL